MLMAAAEESVNKSICISLSLFVIGIADEDDDNNRYAIICSKQSNSQRNQKFGLFA